MYIKRRRADLDKMSKIFEEIRNIRTNTLGLNVDEYQQVANQFQQGNAHKKGKKLDFKVDESSSSGQSLDSIERRLTNSLLGVRRRRFKKVTDEKLMKIRVKHLVQRH